ncbi:hypothetical protein AB205_0155950 [Aquarana catesbeiana]|uniref:G-protein coupled receptors family 1 profile domain-containing protein n=1 Tax=Aquarana catesbeiana TaxID=8400 RepID=A0A2G9R7C0_AQUCT|nr:hypothetical protein AB205_0155950 [Aquarana catesbeiana]
MDNMRNMTEISYLTLVGLSDHPQTMNGLFVLFLLIYLMTVIINLLIFILVLTDYHLHNPITIIRLRSKTGKRKAFSTCASHLTVVFIFYGSLIFIYLVPTSSNMVNLYKLFSVISALINPLLNPLIYSLRNKDLMEALMRSYYHLKLIRASL